MLFLKCPTRNCMDRIRSTTKKIKFEWKISKAKRNKVISPQICDFSFGKESNFCILVIFYLQSMWKTFIFILKVIWFQTWIPNLKIA